MLVGAKGMYYTTDEGQQILRWLFRHVVRQCRSWSQPYH